MKRPSPSRWNPIGAIAAFLPVYDFTNGIRFGFTLETNDYTNAREIDIR
jgi:hypothetical protein